MSEQDKEVGGKIKPSADKPLADAAPAAVDKGASSKPSVGPAAPRRDPLSKQKSLTAKSRRRDKGAGSTVMPTGQAAASSSAAVWLAVLALLLAGGAAAGSYWLWQQGASDHQMRQQQLEAMQTEIGSAQRQLTAAAQRQQAQWQTFQQQQEQQLGILRQQLSQSRDPNWLLAEAEYLVRIANHRLQLAADVDTAISALSLADQHLQVLRDPRLLAVRRQLAADLGRLKAVVPVDVVGTALTLSSLQLQLQGLPLQGRMMVSEAAESMAPPVDSTNKLVASKDSMQFLSDIWDSLRSLVTIRRVDDESVAVVAVTQRGFLYQNLALKLEAARLALLRQDDALYHQSLATVQDWLQRYFDQQHSAVQSLQRRLQQLDTIKLDRELPIATASLQAIQRLRSNSPLVTHVGVVKKKVTAMPANATVVANQPASPPLKDSVKKAEDVPAPPPPSSDKAMLEDADGPAGETP